MLFSNSKIHSNFRHVKMVGGMSIIEIDGILQFRSFSYSEHKVMVRPKTGGIRFHEIECFIMWIML